MSTVVSNQIKKGTKLRLKNGWNATMMDNRRGSIRTMEVQGLHTEIGDNYVWEIKSAFIDGQWKTVQLTKNQQEQRDRIKGLGF
jgi:hypothetical protein